MDLIALATAGVWGETIVPVLLMVIGFGLVIFFHELGHFLACKAVGITVERFAIGFGPSLFSFVWKGTDYCIKILPLGGYVKMLGQEDFKPLEEDEVGDPNAYNNKPIWARMVVISAGVVMNIIMAATLFVVVFMVGINFSPPVVGDVTPGFPGSQVKTPWDVDADKPGGLKPGDRIVELDGREIRRFFHIRVAASMAKQHDVLDAVIERRVGDKVETGHVKIGVRVIDPSIKLLGFGIMPAPDTVFADFGEDSPSPFPKDSRLLSIGDISIKDYWDIKDAERALDSGDVVVKVDNGGVEENITVTPTPVMDVQAVFLKSGRILRGYADRLPDDDTSVVVVLDNGNREKVAVKDIEPTPLDVLGLIPRLRISSVLDGSPADKKGLKRDDIIVRFGDHDTPTLARFHELCEHFEGKGTDIVVLRKGKRLDPIKIAPKSKSDQVLIGFRSGIDAAHPVVAGVRKGSLAEQAGLRAGDIIEQIGDRKISTWNDIVAARRSVTTGELVIRYKRGVIDGQATIPDLAAAQLRPEDYRFTPFAFSGMPFKPLMNEKIKTGPISAIAMGATETYYFTAMTYATLRGLAMRTVSPKQLRGPIGIFDAGIDAGRQGTIRLVYLMAIISISLAVINFLPIPVVDGGHAMFLIIEKVRGKPISLKVMNIIQLIGIALLLFVFVAVTWNDIARIAGDLW